MLAHLFRPCSALGRRAKHGIGPLLNVQTGVIVVDDPSPYECTPGTLWIVHGFQHVVVLVTGVVAIVAARDQAQSLRVDLLQEVPDQGRQLRGQSGLT